MCIVKYIKQCVKVQKIVKMWDNRLFIEQIEVYLYVQQIVQEHVVEQR